MADDAPSFPDVLIHGSDPIGQNPFPSDHPAHERWEYATRVAEEQAYRLDADFLSDVAADPVDLNAKIAARMVALFGIWNLRYINVTFVKSMLRNFDAWVATYAEACLDTAKQSFKGPEPMRNAAEADLQRELMGKLGHWKAEARRFLREAQAAATPESTDATPPVSEAGAKTVKTTAAPVTPKSIPKKVGGPLFAAWLFGLMEQRNHMNVNELYELSGVAAGTINSLLTGKPSRRWVVAKLCDALGVDIASVPQD